MKVERLEKVYFETIEVKVSFNRLSILKLFALSKMLDTHTHTHPGVVPIGNTFKWSSECLSEH